MAHRYAAAPPEHQEAALELLCEPKHGSKGRIPAWVHRSWVPGFIVGIYLALSLYDVTLPGFYGDETSEITPLLPVTGHYPPVPIDAQPGTLIYFGAKPFPLFVHPYVGSVKSMVYFPFAWIFGESVYSIRVLTICIGALALIMTYIFIKRAFSGAAAVVGTGLLALDNSYLLFTKVDFGPTAIPTLAKMAALVCLLTWWRNRNRLLLASGGFILGVGLYNKADFSWIIGALAVATLVVFWREVRSVLSLDTCASFGAGFVAGAAIFIWFNLRYPLLSFRSPNPGHVTWWSPDVLSGDLHNRVVLLSQLLGGTSMDVAVGLAPSQVWPFPFGSLVWPAFIVSMAAGLAISLFPIGDRRLQRGTRWLLIVMALFFSCTVVVPSAFGLYHVLPIYPFPQILIAVVLTDGINWLVRNVGTKQRYRLKAVGFAVALILLASNAIVVGNNWSSLERTGGSTRWSDAIYRLAAYVESRPPSVPVHMMDWALRNRVAVLTDGRVDGVDEPWPALLDPAGASSIETALLADKHAVFVINAPGSRMFPKPWDTLVAYAGQHGMKFQPTRVLYQRDGVPNIEVGQFIATKEKNRSIVSTPKGRAFLAAMPAPAARGSNIPAWAVEWDTGDRTSGQVFVSEDGGPQVLFAEGPSGSGLAPWMTHGRKYTFALYAGKSHSRLLGTILVRP